MKYFVFGLTAIFLALCSKEVQFGQKPLDYLIFGHFYGHCIGKECVEIFKLTSDGLYENTTDSYLASEFDFSAMEQDKFDMARELKSAIPVPLFQSTDTTFGCPDCADQGGLYIEISSKGKRQNWRIDQDKRMVPGYLHSFMDKVNQTIESIQQL